MTCQGLQLSGLQSPSESCTQGATLWGKHLHTSVSSTCWGWADLQMGLRDGRWGGVVDVNGRNGQG